MQTRREIYKSIKDIPHEEYLAAGTGLCGGCGGLLALRLFHKALGRERSSSTPRLHDPAGRLSFSPFHASWLYTAMASAPREPRACVTRSTCSSPRPDRQKRRSAGGGGDRRRGRHGIGLQATLAAIHRGLDFYYFCYDNEAFANTGFQMSRPRRLVRAPRRRLPHRGCPPARRRASRTSSSCGACSGRRLSRRCRRRIARPDGQGGAGGAGGRTKALRRPVLVSTGLGCRAGGVGRGGEARVDSGVWPLKEVRDGTVVHTVVPHQRRPVEDYLRPQARYRHLFEPTRQEEVLRQLQADVDRYWAQVPAINASFDSDSPLLLHTPPAVNVVAARTRRAGGFRRSSLSCAIFFSAARSVRPTWFRDELTTRGAAICW